MNRQPNPPSSVKIVAVMMLKNVKFVKRGIIVLDVVLVLVAMIILFNYLLFPKSVDWLSDLPEEKPESIAKATKNIYDREYYFVISQLPNGSKKISSSTNKEVWVIDPNEAALLRDANKINDMLNNDAKLSPYPSGGVKIESPTKSPLKR